MSIDTDATHNIADSLAGLLPRPIPMGFHAAARGTPVQLTAMPPGWAMHEADAEKFDDTPRATKGKAVLAEPASFIDYIKRQQGTDKPWFVWMNTTHMHLYTHTKPESRGQAGLWQSAYHDTMIDHDGHVGKLLDLLDDDDDVQNVYTNLNFSDAVMEALNK